MAKDTETPQLSTPWQKFLALARKVVRTPKADADKRERAWRENRGRRNAKSSRASSS